MKTSQISGFYKLPPAERLNIVQEFAGLTDEECAAIANTGGLPMDTIDRMVENAIGTFDLPMGIATNFEINGKGVLIPMATEEPSVIAAASNAAKRTLPGGGFKASSTEPIMIGQIQLVNVESPFGAKMEILANKEEILRRANEVDPILVKFGGGAKDIEVRVLDTIKGPMVVTHILVDTRDAMGANAVNTMAETIAPYIEELTGGKVYLRILSNLAVYRLARATATWTKDAIGGENVVDGVVTAYAFAAADPYRAATHNKGIMNGISAVVRATGNDTRAVEAGAHAYASREGRYTSLTTYEKNENGDLVGTIELPMPVGLIGGATKVHPVAKAAVKILGINSANELGQAMAVVGLAQNLGAMRALATEGIQRGHMKLHAKNLAVTAGATPDILEEVVARLVKEGVRADVADRIIKEIRGA
jgi:hydroxymethylglutaryl-CoA reductase